MTQTVKQDLRTVASDIEYAINEHDWALVQEVSDYLNEYAESIPAHLVMIKQIDYEDFMKFKKDKATWIESIERMS